MNWHSDSHDQDTKDFLTSYKCFRVANIENINEIIFQLAHPEIAQKPRYIAT